MATEVIDNVKIIMTRTVLIALCILVCCSSAYGYQIKLENDGPIVAGGTVNFLVTVYDGNNLATDIDLKYDWEDNAIPQHTRVIENQNATDSWKITYNASIYPAGSYIGQVIVSKCVIWDSICYPIGSARTQFEISGTLHGSLEMQQNNKTRRDKFVSNTETVIHVVDLKKSDKEYINKAPTVLTYWFVDCTYYGITTDLKFSYNYTNPDESHLIEALVMADFTPLPPTTTVPPSTTTTKPTTTTTTKPTTTTTTTTKPTTTATTTKPTTTTKPDVKTTSKPNNTSLVRKELVTSSVKTISRRSIGDSNDNKNVASRIFVIVNGTRVPYNVSFPYVCNGTQVASDPMKTYGHFYKRIEVKAPISNVNITGNNWIQPGDLLSLKISCTGSKDIEFCVQYLKGEYNKTGNETCKQYDRLDVCNFHIKRYLWYPKNTIIIIIKNEINKIVMPVTVNIYEVHKKAQLSVIVVPVAFSLVAVVLIVFGVAYYIQNRSRFIIEVADFNFGQQYSDMEYKTFRERLRESIANAFSRGPIHGSSEVPVWPPGQKYGSMT